MQMTALLSAVYYPSDINILHISGCTLQMGEKKKPYTAIQVNSFIILLNISLFFRFLGFYLPKTKQECVFLHM